MTKKLPNHLRINQTPAEKIVWELLRNRKFMNLKFRRQHPVEGFILDFYCAELKLAIEIDGKIHDKQKEYDEFRQDVIEKKGLRFIRLTNEEVLQNNEIIYYKIKEIPLSIVSSVRTMERGFKYKIPQSLKHWGEVRNTKELG